MRQLVLQPNGKFAVYCSVVDGAIFWDITPEEYANFLTKVMSENIRQNVKEIAQQLTNGEKPYFNSTISYDELVSKHDGTNGDVI